MKPSLEETICDAVERSIAEWGRPERGLVMMSVVGCATFYHLAGEDESMTMIPFRKAQTFEAAGLVKMLETLTASELYAIADEEPYE